MTTVGQQKCCTTSHLHPGFQRVIACAQRKIIHLQIIIHAIKIQCGAETNHRGFVHIRYRNSDRFFKTDTCAVIRALCTQADAVATFTFKIKNFSRFQIRAVNAKGSVIGITTARHKAVVITITRRGA